MKKLISILTLVLFFTSAFAQAELIKLEPIVVTATRDNSLVENYPGSVQVITKQEIENTPADDIPDLLKSVPGIEVYKRGNRDYDIDLRGFNNGGGNGIRVLLLINGIPAKNGDSGKLDWDVINVDEIEKIEIIKGNGGAIYGNGAISGVINIITADEKMGTTSSVEMNYGSYNKSGAFINLSQSIKNGFYSIKANYENSDGYRKKDEYEGKDFKFTVANFYKNTKLKANISYGIGNQSYPDSLTKDDINKYGATYQGSYITTQDFKILIANGSIQHFYNPTTDLNLNVGYKDRYYSYDKSYGVVSRNKVYNLFLKGHKRVFIKKNVKTDIFSGIDLEEESISSKDVEVDNKIAGFYLKGNFDLIQKIILSTSYRYDQLENLYTGKSVYKKLYKMDSYNIGSLWKIYNENSIYINHSKAFRIPTRDEIVKFENTGWPNYTITNISLCNIKPEKAINYEVGFKTYPVPFVNLNASLFYMNVKDEILATGSWTTPNTNFKEIAHRGLESSLTVTPIRQAKVNINYTYQYIFFTEGEYKNKLLPLSPKNRVSIGISIFPIKGLSIIHLTEWRDKCYAANDLKNEKDMLKSYWVSDLKIMYKHKKVKAEFNIYNLYNENYSEFAGINSNGNIGYYPSDRRNYDLSVSLYF